MDEPLLRENKRTASLQWNYLEHIEANDIHGMSQQCYVNTNPLQPSIDTYPNKHALPFRNHNDKNAERSAESLPKHLNLQNPLETDLLKTSFAL